MSIKDMKIEVSLSELVEVLAQKKEEDLLAYLVGEKVLIRDNRAGVFVTTLDAVNGKQWSGLESRKIHYWEGAGAVEGIAETGIDFHNSRITVQTEQSNGQDLVQICVVSDDIYDQIMGAPVWNPK